MARDNEQIVRRRLLYNYLDYSRPCLPLRHFTEIQANSYRGSSMIRLMFPATTSDRKSFLYPIILLLVLFLPAISHPVVAAQHTENSVATSKAKLFSAGRYGPVTPMPKALSPAPTLYLPSRMRAAMT